MILNDKNSLKFISYNRLINDLIEKTIKDCNENFGLTILIVDNYSSKVLSSFLKMSDLLTKGILSIELINSKRNKNPNYNAIYFLSPSNKSCNLLKNDFNDLKNPSYNRIYLFFTHKLSDHLLEDIITEGVIQHTVLIKEFNLSYFIFNENIFNLEWESGLKIFNCKYEEEDKILKSLSERIFTILSTLNISPYIQYQKNSKLCIKLSDKLEEILNNDINMKNKKKEGIILLTDRTIDPISPLLHDYNYQSICHDLLSIKNKKIEFKGNIINLSDEDELWNNFKLNHIAKVFEKLLNYFEFKNKDINKYDNFSFNEMKKYLKDKNNLKISHLIKQLNLADLIREKYNLYKINKIIEFEQDIITHQINNSEILIKINEIKVNLLENQKENYLRLLLILYLTNLKGKFNELYDNLSKEENNIFNNLKYININNSKKIINKNLFENELPINKNISKIISYNQIKSSPNLIILLEKALKFSLDEDNFPYKNYKKEEIKKMKINIKPFIIFNIGGISYNEIVSFEKLLKYNNVNDKIYFGSTCIMKASEYINQLKNIDKDNNIEMKKDCFEFSEDENNEDVYILNVKNNYDNDIKNFEISSEKEKLLDDNDLFYI